MSALPNFDDPGRTADEGTMPWDAADRILEADSQDVMAVLADRYQFTTDGESKHVWLNRIKYESDFFDDLLDIEKLEILRLICRHDGPIVSNVKEHLKCEIEEILEK